MVESIADGRVDGPGAGRSEFRYLSSSYLVECDPDASEYGEVKIALKATGVVKLVQITAVAPPISDADYWTPEHLSARDGGLSAVVSVYLELPEKVGYQEHGSHDVDDSLASGVLFFPGVYGNPGKTVVVPRREVSGEFSVVVRSNVTARITATALIEK